MKLTIMNTRKSFFYKILFRDSRTSFYRAYFSKCFHFPSHFILHWVSKHLIEEALSEIVEIFKLLLLQTNQLVYLVKFGNYLNLSGFGWERNCRISYI